MEKHNVIRRLSHHFVVRVIVVLLLVSNFFTVVLAQETNPKPVNAVVKYLGEHEDKLVFEVDYANDSQEYLNVEITDKDGYVFYRARYKDGAVKKKFAIAKTDMENNTLTFIMSTSKNIKQESFDINRTRVIEGIQVVKQNAGLAKQ